MSIKSLIQSLILILILLIIGGVYYKYFNNKKDIAEEINSLEKNNSEQLEDLKTKIIDLELKNEELNKKIENSKNGTISKVLETKRLDEKKEIIEKTKESKIIKSKEVEKKEKNKIIVESKESKLKEIEKKSVAENKEIKNLVKDVEYTSVDQRGNKFNLLATSGKSNDYNNDILDLKNVRGKITSDFRDTIYIVSDFAQYNSANLNSKFYENVIINYQDKEITCVNFDINMETNKAIAYNNVIITDPKSVMKAGIVEFDLKTKDIDINPESALTEVQVITNN